LKSFQNKLNSEIIFYEEENTPIFGKKESNKFGVPQYKVQTDLRKMSFKAKSVAPKSETGRIFKSGIKPPGTVFPKN